MFKIVLLSLALSCQQWSMVPACRTHLSLEI